MKITKIMKTIVVSMLVLTLSLAMLITVNAEVDPLISQGTEENQADGYVTKVLQMADGIVTPDVSFDFEFEAIDLNGNSDETSLAAMPSLDTKTISFDADDIPSDEDADGIYETKDIIAMQLGNVNWPHAGEYTYVITETEEDAQGVTYSKARYIMTVYVANGANDGDVYVKYVAVLLDIEDDGTDIEDVKVQVDSDIDENGVIFTNQYRKSADLTISKVVAGEYADQTKLFDYSITLVQSPLETSVDDTYSATIYNANGEVASTVSLGIGTSTFKLSHAQYIVIKDLPVGVTYETTESAAADYSLVLL